MTKILVIDDDVDFGELTLRRLRRMGFECKLLPGAHGAIDLLLRDGYSLVLLDVNMPGLSGTDVLQTIRTLSSRNIKIVLFSSHDHQELRLLAEEHGADGYLSKTASSTEIELKVLSLLGQPLSSRWSRPPLET